MAATNNFEMLNPSVGRTQMDQEFLRNLSESNFKSVAVEEGTAEERGVVNIQADFSGGTYTIENGVGNFVFKRNESRVDAFIYFNLVLDSPPQTFNLVKIWLPTEFGYAGFGTPMALIANAHLMNEEQMFPMSCMAITSDPYVECRLPGVETNGVTSGGSSASSYVSIAISGFFYRRRPV
jgi:hypothetical protein